MTPVNSPAGLEEGGHDGVADVAHLALRVRREDQEIPFLAQVPEDLASAMKKMMSEGLRDGEELSNMGQ
jgi:alpha-D-ribose 1-methylphosphonate 5-triphosphate synthase subunit PhnI